MRLADFPDVEVVIPHPHDVGLAKLERMEVNDREPLGRILDEYPLTPARLDELVAEMPHRCRGVLPADRVARFDAGLRELRAMIAQR